jgi:membrane-bound lytic murein transglycosylase D
MRLLAICTNRHGPHTRGPLKWLTQWVLAVLCVLTAACSHLTPAPDLPVLPAVPQTVQEEPAEVSKPMPIWQDDLRPVAPTRFVHDSQHAQGLSQPNDPPLDLWDRLRQGFALPALEGEAAQRAKAAAQRYAQSGLLQRSASRAQVYLYPFVAEAEKRGLPLELALLPYVESALNPNARSPVGAVGACQFMPATGKRFDLVQSAWVDQRRDVLRCANAMFDYLTENHARFGSWHLALAAYNWGEGAVARAIEKNRTAGLGTAYEDLRMPRETQNYVPALMGLAAVVADAQSDGTALPHLPNAPPWVEVQLPADMDVQRVLQLAGISQAEFDRHNPGIMRPVIPKAVQESIVLPPVAAERFVQALARQRAPLATWGAWRVPRTQTLAQIAKQLGTTAAVLAQANDVPAKHRVLAGSVLAVPKTKRHDIDERSASEGVLRTAAPPKPAAKKKKPRKPMKKIPKRQV